MIYSVSDEHDQQGLTALRRAAGAENILPPPLRIYFPINTFLARKMRQ